MLNGQDNGGVIRHDVADYPTYITMWADAGDALGAVLMSTAPASRIRITEGVDYTLSKSLSGDFLVSTFGHKPLTIEIDGFDIFYDRCKVAADKPTVQAFYDKWNVHVNKDARINVGMAGASGAGTAYRCVLVALTRSTDAVSGLDTEGVGSYNMVLLGAQLTGNGK
jgi:hypothetical protein